jgi:hypothetical protein
MAYKYSGGSFRSIVTSYSSGTTKQDSSVAICRGHDHVQRIYLFTCSGSRHLSATWASNSIGRGVLDRRLGCVGFWQAIAISYRGASEDLTDQRRIVKPWAWFIRDDMGISCP